MRPPDQAHEGNDMAMRRQPPRHILWCINETAPEYLTNAPRRRCNKRERLNSILASQTAASSSLLIILSAHKCSETAAPIAP
jgi:hypothetical protein